MCKLCNSNNPASNISKPACQKSGKSVEFKKIVHEYTGEFPCNLCIGTYLTNEHKNGIKDIDDYIFTRLKRFYLNPIFTQQDKNQWSYLTRHGNKTRKKHGKGHLRNCKVIEKYITQTSHVSFTVLIQRNFIKYRKSFNTLKEAQQFKKEVLNGNYTHIA